MTYLSAQGSNFIMGTLKGEVSSDFGGLRWLYTNTKGESLSVILHTGSYGGGRGLFEAAPSWKGDVIGYLSFGEVQKLINTLERRGKH